MTVELTDGGGGDAKWAVDADALTEALVAVAENAVAASAKGSTVAIAARTDESSEQAEVTITDGATPIGAAEIAKVFHMGSPRSKGSVGLMSLPGLRVSVRIDSTAIIPWPFVLIAPPSST